MKQKTLVFERAGEQLAPGSGMLMLSTAGHDAQYVARVMPAGMLFVPSIGRVSHITGPRTQRQGHRARFEVYAKVADHFLSH
ncbi:hypothetical protein BQ8482_440011 [Mesorhizobium delmotii]|uniref:Uncharacterized protein n=1 Tax=Mesorhizobium delmotii TaxID=1631247 RepID=A0A2P9ATL3_9HYPH|nr:hypothetical protein [Mesorhizobium delmotii]SJM34457.1 hypothetical protein BQ8482_440011 [Mesorhizobium delmotii]